MATQMTGRSNLLLTRRHMIGAALAAGMASRAHAATDIKPPYPQQPSKDFPLFPDLQLADPSGTKILLSQLRGNVVLLHFWGAWCPPCRKELPAVFNFYNGVKNIPDFKMVLIDIAERMEQGNRYLKSFGMEMPNYDPLSFNGSQKGFVTLANGDVVASGKIGVTLYPDTVLLDRNGLTLFNTRDNEKDHDVKWDSLGSTVQDVLKNGAPSRR